jgi:hypothetical protein
MNTFPYGSNELKIFQDINDSLKKEKNITRYRRINIWKIDTDEIFSIEFSQELIDYYERNDNYYVIGIFPDTDRALKIIHSIKYVTIKSKYRGVSLIPFSFNKNL